ncbi:hypothetical protein [Streptomyces crystallinus]|uniref:Uncharacterized protein n=1 Tax=Streptomyces crystallinus TaxID=68191 RepID=A0ABP3RQC0_9ACTN
MTTLPTRVDGDGTERQASARETHRAEGTSARIRGEVAEIRTAADDLAVGTDFDRSLSAFLTVQAELLKRHGATAQHADSLSRNDDTRDDPGMFPTAARSALLISRAHHATHGGH